MGADGLVMQGARASASMILALLSPDNSVPAQEDLNILIYVLHNCADAAVLKILIPLVKLADLINWWVTIITHL